MQEAIIAIRHNKIKDNLKRVMERKGAVDKALAEAETTWMEAEEALEQAQQ
ncbi:MAG: hypothetical protein ACQUYJ_11960 [Ferruginibacter sp.]